MQPHSQEYTKQKSIKLYFLLHKTFKNRYYLQKMLLYNEILYVITKQK